MSRPPELAKCHRTACETAADVRGYNRITHGLYCIPCADRIELARRDLVAAGQASADHAYFPFRDACSADEMAGGSWAGGLVVSA